MKTRKAHKRVSKLDELLADLSEGYSKGALHIHAAVEGAKVAVAHLKAAISAQAADAGKSEATSGGAPKPTKRKLSAAHRRAIQEGVRRRVATKKAAATSREETPKKKTRPVSKKRA